MTAICVNNELQVGIIDDGVGLPDTEHFALTCATFRTPFANCGSHRHKNADRCNSKARNRGDPFPRSVFLVARALYRVSRWVMLDSRPVYIPECSARVSALDVDLT